MLLTRCARVLLLCVPCHGNAICQADLCRLEDVQDVHLIKEHGDVPGDSYKLLFSGVCLNYPEFLQESKLRPQRCPFET